MGNKPPRVSSNNPVPHQPPYVFLYGVAGVGKSFCAELLARRLGYKSYDLDQHVTPAMQAAAREDRSFTDEMRDEFFAIVSEKMKGVMAGDPRVIFHQGAYKERHRSFLKGLFPEVCFVEVTAPLQTVSERVSRRGNWVSPEFAAVLLKNFEASQADPRLLNDGRGEEELVSCFLDAISRS